MESPGRAGYTSLSALLWRSCRIVIDDSAEMLFNVTCARCLSARVRTLRLLLGSIHPKQARLPLSRCRVCSQHSESPMMPTQSFSMQTSRTHRPIVYVRQNVPRFKIGFPAVKHLPKAGHTQSTIVFIRDEASRRWRVDVHTVRSGARD